MILKGQDRTDRLSADEMAREILSQQAVLHEYAVHLRSLQSRITAFEKKYSLPSDRIHEAIENGELRETNEVCEWIMTVELLERNQAIISGR